MTMRSRSFLVDNTLGKLFTNTTTTSLANATNLIAGTKLSSKGISQASNIAARVATQLPIGTLGTSGLLVGVNISTYSLGNTTPYKDTIIKLKYGTPGYYINSRELLNTDPTTNYKWVLPRTSKVVSYPLVGGTYPIAFTWSNSEFFWVDISQVSPGTTGLVVTLLYYLG